MNANDEANIAINNQINAEKQAFEMASNVGKMAIELTIKNEQVDNESKINKLV